ncbi:MAG: phosphatidylglycerophosphatase A [Candidatus Hydrothermarchaeota archaeon]
MEDIEVYPMDKYIIISLKEEFTVYSLKETLKTDRIVVFEDGLNLEDLKIQYPRGFFFGVENIERCIFKEDQKSFLLLEFFNGKINTLLILREIAENAIQDLYALIGEAKAYAFLELDAAREYCSYNAVLAIKEINPRKIDYDEIFKKTKELLKDALIKQKNIKFPKTILEKLEEKKIFLRDLVEAGMALYIGEESEIIKKELKKELIGLSEDINISSLILAGIKLEEELAHGKIKGLSNKEDPSFLYADEILGMAIANEIAGTKGIFNFKRYDEKKPGIIREQGIFMDDVLAGFVAGALSRLLYSK